VSTDSLGESTVFTHRYMVKQGEEQAVVIGVRDYNRLIERLDGCTPGGWADLWLAGVGAGVAVVMGALVGALTLPGAMSGTRDALWAVTGGGAIMLLLCLFGYFTQRRGNDRELAELLKDLESHKPSQPGLS
jgi:hypothetical protein